jgi:hypothetical protein
MKSLHASALGTVSLSLLFAGCGGPAGSLPTALSPASGAYATATLRGACSAVTSVQNFDATVISPGSSLWFTSTVSAPGKGRPLDVEMRQSLITFTAGHVHYRIQGPNMRLSLTEQHAVHLRFDTRRYDWRLEAPRAASGSAFLNAAAYRLERRLPGDIKDVTWSAMFYSKAAGPIRWRWAAGVYSTFSSVYGKLAVKPLDDNHFPPYNSDPAGTPEAYKQYATGGATDGALSAPVDVTPCRG